MTYIQLIYSERLDFQEYPLYYNNYESNACWWQFRVLQFNRITSKVLSPIHFFSIISTNIDIKNIIFMKKLNSPKNAVFPVSWTGTHAYSVGQTK